jgi:ParB family chromosome partitioning protein
MPSPKSGLGRGFDSLIPQNFDNSLLLDESERIQKLPVEKVSPNPDQPRRLFDETALKELASSLSQHGILQPLVVTATKDGYRIRSEERRERRWRAAQLAKLKTVPAIVRGLKELEELEIALVENVQRVDLSPLEQAVSIERLHEQFSLTYEQIAKKLGKATPTVHNTVRLLQLPPAARDALIATKISEGHARAILALKGQAEHQAVKARVDTDTPETKRLGKRLGTKVQVRRTAKGGKLEISFKSDDELARIIGLIENQ